MVANSMDIQGGHTSFVPKHEDMTRIKSHFLAHEAVIILSIPLAGGRKHDTAV